MPASATTASYSHGTKTGIIVCQVTEATAASVGISRGEWERWQSLAPEWTAKLTAMAVAATRKAQRKIKATTFADAEIDPETTAARPFRAEHAEPVRTPGDGCGLDDEAHDRRDAAFWFGRTQDRFKRWAHLGPTPGANGPGWRSTA